MTCEAKTKILAALRETLEEELRGCEAGTAVGGPWGAVVNQADVWAETARLSSELYRELRGKFSDDVVREILLAAGGVKVSRTYLSDAKFEVLQSIGSRHGFHLVAGKERFILRPDKGKGGWCNRTERVIGPDENKGVRNVYIAADASLAEAAKMFEEAGMDDLFGALLGIPRCCREAYERLQPVAQASQYDFVLLVLENTPGDTPYDFWLNYAAQYFGRSLLSFFPCSFRCSSAGAAARRTFEMLAGCDPGWARSFLELHRTNILYTENRGLHLFRQPLMDGSICYGPRDVDSTELTEVATMIRLGNRLEVGGRHRVTVHHGSERIGSIEGEDVGMCIFS